jgi:acetyl-CoA synthetase
MLVGRFRLPCRGNERRRPDVHPLYFRLDGKPKGVLHTTGGYLLHASLSHQYVFDYHDGEFTGARRMWLVSRAQLCCYGPLANGATTLMFEGVPHYPDPSRFWQCATRQSQYLYTARRPFAL